MNSVNLVGNIGNTVELLKTENGKDVCKIDIGVRRNKDTTDWISCVAYEQTARLITQYHSKGDRIGISGSFFQIRYTDKKTNENRSMIKVLISSITFVKSDSRETQEKKPAPTGNPKYSEIDVDEEDDEFSKSPLLDISSDDLPF